MKKHLNFKNSIKESKIYRDYIRSDDWYYQHSWFERKYFIHKLKRKIMNVILNVWKHIEDILLHNYYAEIKFSDKNEFFKAYMPIIIRCKDYREAEKIIAKIGEELRDIYSFEVFGLNILKELATPEIINLEKEKIINGQRGIQLAEIEFNIYTVKNISPKLLNYLPNTFKDSSIIGDYKLITKEVLNFSIVRKDDKYILPDKFQVMLKIIETELPSTKLSVEEEKERMKYLMNYKKQ